jgi:2'-5' RNA ligase
MTIEYGYVYYDNFPNKIINLFKEITQKISLNDTVNSEDYKDEVVNGIVNNYHLTLFYGLPKERDYQIFKSIDMSQMFKFNHSIRSYLLYLDTFNTKDYDILIVKSELTFELSALNYRIKTCLKLDEVSEFGFVPHITLAYLKKGICNKYKNLNNYYYFGDYKYKINKIVFENYNDTQIKTVNI